jgi:hypothetical protein
VLIQAEEYKRSLKAKRKVSVKASSKNEQSINVATLPFMVPIFYLSGEAH